MKKLLAVFVLSCMLFSEVVFGYTLSDKDILVVKQRIEVLNNKIKKGSSYESIYKQQLLIQNNTKKRRDRMKTASSMYRILDKNLAISQYILENLIDSKGFTKIIQQSSQSGVLIQSCESSWHFDQGLHSCQPDSATRRCTIQNGSAMETWNGNAWGSCTPVFCYPGYNSNNGVCSAGQSDQQGTSLSCTSDQHIENNSCTSNTKACSIVNGNGEQYWVNNSYGNCMSVTCNSGYQKNPDSTGCSIIVAIVSQYPGCNALDITLGDKIWSACNVGSSISGFGTESYGGYYQWGRNDVGFTLVTESSPYDWQQPSNGDSWGDTTDTLIARQGPCSMGYHVPTQTEWMRAVEYSNGQYNILRNTLKLPSSGWHASDNSEYYGQNISGFYWSSSPVLNLPKSYYMSINSSNGSITGDFRNSGFRAVGYSVRCVKN